MIDDNKYCTESLFVYCYYNIYYLHAIAKDDIIKIYETNNA